MEKMPVYQVLSRKLSILNQNSKTGEFKYSDQIEEQIETILNSHFPSGSGFDNGCELDFDKSNGNRIEVKIPYHTMDEHGYYDGWIYPVLIVTPSLSYGYNMRINWKGHRGITKFLLVDYFADLFTTVLENEIEYPIIKLENSI